MELMDTGQLFHVDTMHESELNVFMTNYMYSAVDGFLLVSELTLVFLHFSFVFSFFFFFSFLPRSLESRRSLAMRILSICPSVCLSVKRVDCDKTEERSVQIFIPCER